MPFKINEGASTSAQADAMDIIEEIRESCGNGQEHWDDSQPCPSFEIPTNELKEILNAAEMPEEWVNSQPIWDQTDPASLSKNKSDTGAHGFPKNRKRSMDETFDSGDLEENVFDNAIILNEKARRLNKKFSAEEIQYEAKVDLNRLPEKERNISLGGAVDLVHRLFQALIQRVTENLSPQDLVRFCIINEKLDKPISTGLNRVEDVTVEKVMGTVFKVLQSKEEFLLDENFVVDVAVVKRPVGSGKSRRIINVEVDKLRKRSILTVESDEDFSNLCCAKAIILAKAFLEQDPDRKAMRDKRGSFLLRKAIALHSTSGVPEGPCGYEEIAVFEAHLNLQIVVFASENMFKVSYKSISRPQRINLLLHNGHFDVIQSLTGFFGTDKYCLECETPYSRTSDHVCENLCHVCRTSGCVRDVPERCPLCDRLCNSSTCFERHMRNGICNEIYQCRLCSKVIRWRDCHKNNHICGTVKCPSCNKFVVGSEHRCFLYEKSPATPNDKLIFFDFETDQSTGEHLVNYAVAQYTDGTTFKFEGYETNGDGNDACAKFCKFLFDKRHKDFTVIAHNMKGFDGQFIVAWLLKQGKEPEVIPNGSMIMSISVRELNIKIIDSFNFLPMGLAKLPKTFGMEELHKGYFPHLFNRPENQTFVGPLPPKEDFAPDSMTSNARELFLEWYEKRKTEPFDFRKEMDAYCRSDVDILRRCCLEFRSQFLDVGKVDPFCYITIASACMAVYRGHHLKSDTIAMIPKYGYVNSTNFSRDSIHWIEYVSRKDGVNISHALNGTGEVKIGKHSVDGFCKDNNTIYQYHGCLFHGCDKCFDAELRNPVNDVKMKSLYLKTQERTEELRKKGYTVVEMWEHDFNNLKKTDGDLKEFIQNHELKERLDPRDAFFGGRTNAIQLYFEGSAKYIDFTSLYPWTNKYCRYPVGHPTVITEEFQDIDQYFGMIKCKVIPPRKLYHPVLPCRINSKLLFPLCGICAEEKQKVCNHTDNERALIGTWVSEELKKALKKGYKIEKIYEVYHFEKNSDELFKSYINLFLKIKQEASGWPSHCTTEEDKETYIKNYFENEGILLDASAIMINPGRRQVAKLALNSFWGRWGMNTNKMQLKYITELAEFNRMMSDQTLDISDLYLPTPQVAAIHYRRKSEFVQQDTVTNIFLAAFTTCYARLKLYDELENLGSRVLYMDTDSIIFESDGVNDPPLGDYLGNFTDELGGDVISTFVSAGPKNYAYKTSLGKTECKIRGFTLNFKNSQALNFESVKDLVENMDRPRIITTMNPAKISRDAKSRRVVNRMEEKKYRMVYDKRVIQHDFTTLPYGF